MTDDFGSGEITVPVSDVRHLFVAPDTDPLAQHEGEVMGEPALLRIVRKLMAAREMSGVHKLVVLLRRYGAQLAPVVRVEVQAQHLAGPAAAPAAEGPKPAESGAAARSRLEEQARDDVDQAILLKLFEDNLRLREQIGALQEVS